MPLIRFLLILWLSVNVYAMPQKIILIRHTDKLEQFNPGPSLSPAGIKRANDFAHYYLQKFKITPDFIITINPTAQCQKTICPVKSTRPLQTVAPLITQIYRNNPQTRQDLLFAPFSDDQMQKLVSLLRNADFLNNTFLLICLGHSHIPQFLELLTAGYKLNASLPLKWPGNDFSSVIILNFDNVNKSVDFEILNHQY